jgi:DNA-binding NtrC family response regulator
LRDRGADVVLLARHFLEECARVNRRVVTDFTSDAVTALIDHAWPGNARELRNAIERALIVCDGTAIRAMDLALGPPRRPAAENTLHAVEQDAIQRALRQAGGNRSRAARQLGISRTQLYGRLRRYGLEGTDS